MIYVHTVTYVTERGHLASIVRNEAIVIIGSQEFSRREIRVTKRKDMSWYTSELVAEGSGLSTVTLDERGFGDI